MQSDRQLVDFSKASPKVMRDFLQQEIIILGSTFLDIKKRRAKLRKKENLSAKDISRLNAVSELSSNIRHSFHVAKRHLSRKKPHRIHDNTVSDVYFPPELLAKILSHLNFHDLTSCLSVSKNIKALVESTTIDSQYIYFPKVDIILKARDLHSTTPTYLDILNLLNNLSDEKKAYIFSELKQYDQKNRPDYGDLLCNTGINRKAEHFTAFSCLILLIASLGSGVVMMITGLIFFSDSMIQANKHEFPEFLKFIISALVLLSIAPISFGSVIGIKRCITKQDDETYYSSLNTLNRFFNKSMLNVSAKKQPLLEEIIIDSTDNESSDQIRQAPSSNTNSSSR